jgi:hypothetical protein
LFSCQKLDITAEIAKTPKLKHEDLTCTTTLLSVKTGLTT